MRVLTMALAAALLGAPLGYAEVKEKKPHLDLRANPRFAFSPVLVLVTANLVGGDESEEYYCPQLDWDWDDGSKSTHEADCEPLQPGQAIPRKFTAVHKFEVAGTYDVKLTLSRAERVLAKATVRVTVRAGAGDPTFEEDQ